MSIAKRFCLFACFLNLTFLGFVQSSIPVVFIEYFRPLLSPPMEHQVETTSAARKMSCDFRGFQYHKPQNLHHKEKRSGEKGGHEMTTYSTRKHHEDRYMISRQLSR